MKREKLYIWIIAILVILNLVQVGAFLLAPKPHMRHNQGFRAEAIETLNLNGEQKEQFKSFAEEHRKQMRSLVEHQKSLTKSYFQQPNDSILSLITNIEANKIKITEENLNAIETMLNDNQKQNFDKFKEKALRVILK